MNGRSLLFRQASSKDCDAIWELAGKIDPLRQYDRYIYAVFTHYFSDTLFLIERKNEIIGYAISFLEPTNPKGFFILQFGIVEEERNMIYAIKLLKLVLNEFKHCEMFHFTIKKSNPKLLGIINAVEYVSKSECKKVASSATPNPFSSDSDYLFEVQLKKY